MRFRRVFLVVVALVLMGGASSAPALAHEEAQVVHSVSGAAVYSPTAAWAGSFLFSAVMHADGTVSGRVVYKDGVLGGTTDGTVTHMNVVGNKATVFAELPPDFVCAMCGDAHPTHFFFVVAEGTGQQPDRIGWPLWFVQLGGEWPQLYRAGAHGHDAKGVRPVDGELALVQSASPRRSGPRAGSLSGDVGPGRRSRFPQSGCNGPGVLVEYGFAWFAMFDQDFRVAGVVVRPSLNRVERDGQDPLAPEDMEVLAFLAVRPGRVATRDEVLSAVWPGVSVAEEGLTQCIAEIREALGDNVRQPSYIETVPKRGYRLIVRVEVIGNGEPRTSLCGKHGDPGCTQTLAEGLAARGARGPSRDRAPVARVRGHRIRAPQPPRPLGARDRAARNRAARLARRVAGRILPRARG